MKLAFLLAAVAVAGCTHDDPCRRAFDRLDRIAQARHQLRMRGEFEEQALDACRHAGTAQWDPVLQCAMRSPSDEAAARCIDTGVRAVVHPSAPGAPTGGKGLNPLLVPVD